jgi:hypothetical protein
MVSHLLNSLSASLSASLLAIYGVVSCRTAADSKFITKSFSNALIVFQNEEVLAHSELTT